MLVGERVGECLDRPPGGDLEPHQVDEIVQLAQSQRSVTVHECAGDLAQRPPVEGLGFVHDRDHRTAIGGGRAPRPVVFDGRPQSLVDVTGGVERPSAPLDDPGDLVVDGIELVDEALTLAVEHLALHPAVTGGEAGDAPRILVDPAGRRGQGTIRPGPVVARVAADAWEPGTRWIGHAGPPQGSATGSGERHDDPSRAQGGPMRVVNRIDGRSPTQGARRASQRSPALRSTRRRVERRRRSGHPEPTHPPRRRRPAPATTAIESRSNRPPQRPAGMGRAGTGERTQPGGVPVAGVPAAGVPAAGVARGPIDRQGWSAQVGVQVPSGRRGTGTRTSTAGSKSGS